MISAALAIAIAAVPAILCTLYRRARYSRVVLPWHRQTMPEHALFAQRLRTRDGSKFVVRDPSYCALIFWRAAPNATWDYHASNIVTGGSRIQTVSIDFSHTDGVIPWYIMSLRMSGPRWEIDGPHYMPASSNGHSAWAPVRIEPFVNVDRLRADLEAAIAEPSILHRRLDPIGYLLGHVRPDRVTCSGLIGTAILRQELSPFATALRKALRERMTWGEITPADLARAAAILGLVPEGATRPITVAPLLSWPRYSVSSSEPEKFHA